MNSNFLLALANDDDDTFKCAVCYVNDVIPQDNIIDCCSVGRSLCNTCVVKLNGDNQVGSGKCPQCKKGFPFWLLQHFAVLKLDADNNDGDIHNHNHNQNDNNQAPQYVLGYIDEDGVYHVDSDDDDEDNVSEEEVVVDRRNSLPCRNHFGRNGRQFLHGCTDNSCPYSHVKVNCRFGHGCQRRSSCLFFHPG
jgi:hypothetical protein